jgi:hypothetical protein
MSAVLGEIVWLMSQSPLHKHFFISDLEWFVMTPIVLQQFRLFYDKDKPIGVVFWAIVSAEVEERLAAGTTRLRSQDWKSGDPSGSSRLSRRSAAPRRWSRTSRPRCSPIVRSSTSRSVPRGAR